MTVSQELCPNALSFGVSAGIHFSVRISHTELKVYVEQDMNEFTKVQTLIHEALHGLFHQTGHYDIDQEERIVQMLGCQLPLLLRNNPELVELIMKG